MAAKLPAAHGQHKGLLLHGSEKVCRSVAAGSLAKWLMHCGKHCGGEKVSNTRAAKRLVALLRGSKTIHCGGCVVASKSAAVWQTLLLCGNKIARCIVALWQLICLLLSGSKGVCYTMAAECLAAL